MLTLSSTRSCSHRAGKDRGSRAAVQPMAAVGSFIVVELQEAIKRCLQRPAAGELLPTEGDAPVFVQDRLLEALHDAVGRQACRGFVRVAYGGQGPTTNLLNAARIAFERDFLMRALEWKHWSGPPSTSEFL